jgi:hypothetical protein
MNIFVTTDSELDFSTIEICANQQEWQLISNSISRNGIVLEASSVQEICDFQKDASVQSFKALEIVINNSEKKTEFNICLLNHTLKIQGSRQSLENLKEVSEDFAKESTNDGEHVHIVYIDFDDYEYNWFSNRNIELILSVKSQ